MTGVQTCALPISHFRPRFHHAVFVEERAALFVVHGQHGPLLRLHAVQVLLRDVKDDGPLIQTLAEIVLHLHHGGPLALLRPALYHGDVLIFHAVIADCPHLSVFGRIQKRGVNIRRRALLERVWSRISKQDQEIILEAARHSTNSHKTLWNDAIEQAVHEAESMGVEFIYDVDKDAFRKATEPMIESYTEQYPDVKTLLDVIETARKEK